VSARESRVQVDDLSREPAVFDRDLMVRSGEQTGDPVTHLNVVLNWFEELKRRVPTE